MGQIGHKHEADATYYISKKPKSADLSITVESFMQGHNRLLSSSTEAVKSR